MLLGVFIMNAEQKAPYLSVIIPCWNEAKNLEHGVLGDIHQYLGRQEYSWEVIVVNDGSTDGSRDRVLEFIAGKPGFFLHDIPHQGKLGAIEEGIGKARGEVVLFTDMDQSTPIGELDKLLSWYRQGFEIVIGSRGRAREGSSLLRKLGSLIFLTLRRLVLLGDIIDTQCGFKLCRRQTVLDIFPRLQARKGKGHPAGWSVSAYDVEFLYLCEKAGFKIKEVEVSWCNRDLSDTKGSEGDVSRYVRESIDMARSVTRVKLNQLEGKYN